MAGTIRKRGNSWQVLLSWRDENSRTQQVSATRPTKKLAELALAELMVQRDTQRLVVGRDTFADVAERYMQIVAPTKAETTQQMLRSNLRRHLLPAFGHLPMKKITPMHLDALYRKMEDEGLSANGIRSIHDRMSGIFTQAVKWGVIADSPTRRATPPRTTKPPFAVLAPDALQRVLEAAESVHPIARAYLTVVAAAGARRIEICHLRRGDVDWEAETITITRSKTEAGEGRVVVLDPSTMALLAEHCAKQEALMAELGVIPSPDHYVFNVPVGHPHHLLPEMFEHPLCVDLPTRWMRSAKNLAGISERVRLHDLRHTHVTHLLEAGVPVSVVSGRVGHSAASMTYKYGHRTNQGDRAAAEAMGRILTNHDATIVPIRKEA